MKNRKYWSKGRSVSDLKAHIVLTTKYRKSVLTGAMIECIRENLARLIEQWDCELIEMNGENNHIHLMIRYYPDTPLPKLIGNIKSVTSRKVREQFEAELSQTYLKGSLWNGSYFVTSCGGVTINQLKEYIDGQNTPD